MNEFATGVAMEIALKTALNIATGIRKRLAPFVSGSLIAAAAVALTLPLEAGAKPTSNPKPEPRFYCEGLQKSSTAKDLKKCIQEANEGKKILYVISGNDRIRLEDYCKKSNNAAGDICRNYLSEPYSRYREIATQKEAQESTAQSSHDKECRTNLGTEYTKWDGSKCVADPPSGISQTEFQRAYNAKENQCKSNKTPIRGESLQEISPNGSCKNVENYAQLVENEKQEKDKQTKLDQDKKTCEQKRGYEFTNNQCVLNAEFSYAKLACETKSTTHKWDDASLSCKEKTTLDYAVEREKASYRKLTDAEKKLKALEDRKKANEEYQRNQDLIEEARLAKLKTENPDEFSKNHENAAKLKVLQDQRKKEFKDEKAWYSLRKGKGFQETITDGQVELAKEKNAEIENAYNQGKPLEDDKSLWASATDDAQMKTAKNEVSAAGGTYSEDSKSADKLRMKKSYSEDMRIEQAENFKYGGHYGGLAYENTEKVNQAIAEGLKQAGNFNSGVLNLKGNKAQQDVQSGKTNTQEASANIVGDAADSMKSQAWTETVGALGQAFQYFRHQASKRQVKGLQRDTESEILAEQQANQNDTNKVAHLENEKKIVTANGNGEVKQQNEYMLKQGLTSLATGWQARQSFVAAQQLKETSKQMAAEGTNYYGLNLGNGVFTPGGIDPALVPPPSSDALVAPAALEETRGDQGGTLADARDGDDLKEKPVGGLPFASVPLNPGNAGGGGAGSAGGTSRAQDESGGGPAPVKDPKAGTYAASEGGGGAGKYASRGGGGSGDGDVKVDSAFADLLKKFLPGAEEPKTSSPLDLAAKSERSPASDQAAVIGRNKNIFDEIHKRYQKKNAEGAILF